jgi:dTDP-4-amino-4,6-dideoxygalactose transaminase
MTQPAAGIEDFFRRRYEREALYVPSGRMALYLAFREWLRPGNRVLLSPVNDDVVFFTVLAAGLVPVAGPLDPATGNLDPGAVPGETWKSLHAVMTTNLYGLPDRMDLLETRCHEHGLLLIEDACQALDTRVGNRRIGQFSSLAAFSLTKHVPGAGGVLVFTERERHASLLRSAAAAIRRPSTAQAARDRASLGLKEVTELLGARGVLAALRRKLRPDAPERDGHRMPYDLEQVLQARREGAGLSRFDRWVRVDNPGYRTQPLVRQIRKTLQELERLEEMRRSRLQGTRKLLSLGLTPAPIRVPDDGSLFRVPLFVADRERALEHLSARGLRPDYIYDPPLDLYADRRLAESLPSPESARAWSRDVLPVDPLLADRLLEILRESPGLLSKSGAALSVTGVTSS